MSWTSVNKKLAELVTTANEHSELPESYLEALEDYRDKAKDYSKATANFCKILQSGSAVSNTQLRKLELQYDEIRAAYIANKSALNNYLGEVLDSRVSTAERCLQCLVLVLAMTVDADQEMSSVLKDLPPTRELLHHHHPSSSALHHNLGPVPPSPCKTAPSNNSLLQRLTKPNSQKYQLRETCRLLLFGIPSLTLTELDQYQISLAAGHSGVQVAFGPAFTAGGPVNDNDYDNSGVSSETPRQLSTVGHFLPTHHYNRHLPW